MLLPGTPTVPHCFSPALSPVLTPRMPEVTFLSAPDMSHPVGRQRTWRGQRQAVPTWCYGLDRKLCDQKVKKLHCPQRGDISGCPLGAGNGQGPCTSCSAHHTPGSGSKYYPYSTDEETESQRGKGWTEEVRLRAGLAPRGPDFLPAPGLPHKTVRTGSWGGSF